MIFIRMLASYVFTKPCEKTCLEFNRSCFLGVIYPRVPRAIIQAADTGFAILVSMPLGVDKRSIEALFSRMGCFTLDIYSSFKYCSPYFKLRTHSGGAGASRADRAGQANSTRKAA